MWKLNNTDEVLPIALLGMTAVTGIVDAVSFLALGHVFTANMTGNLVILGFAVAQAPGVSIARSLAALAAFFVGATIGGKVLAVAAGEALLRRAYKLFAWEIIFLASAMFSASGYSGNATPASVSLFLIIAFTALAMGMRNAAVRKLGVADLTTTVLTLTITGLAADSSLAGGGNPRWQRRLGSILAMFVGAWVGAILIRRSIFLALGVAAVTTLVSSTMILASMRWGSQTFSPHPP